MLALKLLLLAIIQLMLSSNELWRGVIALNLTLLMNFEKSVVNEETLFRTIYMSFPSISAYYIIRA